MNPHDASFGDSADWAALSAAGALTHDEQATFEAHLASGCAACAAEVACYDPVVAALAADVPPQTPHPRLREALLQRVGAAEPRVSPLRTPVLTEASSTRPQRETIIHHPTNGPWEETAVPGVRLRVLTVDRERNQFSALVRMAPGASYPRHVHRGPEECLVLEGDLHIGSTVMRAGDYQHALPGSAHDPQCTENGCLLFITSSLTDEFA